MKERQSRTRRSAIKMASCRVKTSTKKVSFYIAQYPARWTVQSALHFSLPWQTCSFRHQLGFSGFILARQQLCAKAKSLAFPPLSIARYSFIQLSELGRQWRERKCPIFETVTKRRSNQGSLDCESGILPLSYRAPLPVVKRQNGDNH